MSFKLCMFSLGLLSILFYYYGSVFNMRSGLVVGPASSFQFCIILDTRFILCLHMIFRIVLSSSVRIWLEFWWRLHDICTVAKQTQPLWLHEQEMSFHIPVFSSNHFLHKVWVQLLIMLDKISQTEKDKCWDDEMAQYLKAHDTHVWICVLTQYPIR